MKEILTELNKEVGVKGSMVVTQDGIVVASELGRGLEEETVAAMASNVILTIKKSLEEIGKEGFSQLVLTATHGKMVFVDCGIAYLVVVADKTINIDLTLIEISSAAYRIKSSGEIKL